MEAQNKSSTDAHRCSSELWQVDAEMLGVVPGKGFGGSTLSARVAPFLYNGSLQTKAECYFHFLSFFFIKVKILFGFYQLMKTSTYVVLWQK